MTPRKTATKPAPPPEPEPTGPVINSQIVSRVLMGDNREVRITRIPTGMNQDMIRVGINLVPGGETMSGAMFPANYLDDVIAALRKASHGRH